MESLDNLLQYGNERIHEIAGERGIDWDSLNENQREKLIDEILHEHLANINEDRRWDETFARTQDKLAYLAREATRQIADGKSEPMDFNRL